MVGSTRARRDLLPVALLAYGAMLAVFLLVPPLPPFKGSPGEPVGFTFQELLDLFTPVVIIPLAWLVFDLAGGLGRGRVGTVLFLIAAAAWIEAQGMHLAANAIGDAFPSIATRDAFYGTVPGDLDHWLDEVLSHWVWHIGWIAISVLIILAAMRNRGPREEPVTAPALAGGVLQGATFFIVTVEGVTTAIGIPFSIALLAWALIARWRALARQPVVGFYLLTALVALAGYFVWAAVNDWTLPEFSTVWNL